MSRLSNNYRRRSARVLPFIRPRRRRARVPLAVIMGSTFLAVLAVLQWMPDAPSALDNAVTLHAMALEGGDAAFGDAANEDAAYADADYAPSGDRLSARFAFCHSGGGTNCVVDGDTFWFGGTKIRVMDIDTPETHPARCAEELELGNQATQRLREWLNAGPFSLESRGRDTDRYGRQLRVVTRDGASVGTMLVDEGLARPWEGRRRPWC